MKFTTLVSYVALACSSASAVTVYLAGDSTMATASGATTGWGQFLPFSMNVAVKNHAIGGRSARSFTREGRFQTIIDAVQSGDWVVIEFGHNDGGSLSTDNGRTDCPGNGTETCTTVYNGVTETVLTFPAYLQNAGRAMMAKGAKVIMSSQTPNNPWESGTFSYTGNRFVTYAELAASRIGASFIDHGLYTANRFQAVGLTTTNSYFPSDHTHTSPKGADVVQAAFVKAVLCACNGLSSYVKNTTASVPGTCVTTVPCGSTSTSTTTTTTTTTSSGGGGCTVAKYGQCGGIGYTGCTTCASGSTCTYSNDWYSQCL